MSWLKKRKSKMSDDKCFESDLLYFILICYMYDFDWFVVVVLDLIKNVVKNFIFFKLDYKVLVLIFIFKMNECLDGKWKLFG